VFLQKYAGADGFEDRTTRYSVAQVSINNGPAMKLVYLSGQSWCGSGGCTALLLKEVGMTFKIVNKFTLARLPIHVLPSTTKGWHDMTMPVRGGGVSDRVAILRYNGSRYPGNPSTAPTLSSSKLEDSGTELSLQLSGEPLYP